MLETRFKVIFLLVVLFAASLPVIAILRGTVSTPFEAEPRPAEQDQGASNPEPASAEEPLEEELVVIPAGPTGAGLMSSLSGGFTSTSF